MAAILLGMTRTNALDRDPQPQPPANSGERPLSARSSISLVRLGRDERDLILRLSELQARLVTGTSLAKKPVPRSGAVVLHLGDETEVARMGKPRGTRHPEPDSHPIVERLSIPPQTASSPTSVAGENNRAQSLTLQISLRLPSSAPR
jgi:hypothetical protein